MYIFNLYRQK